MRGRNTYEQAEDAVSAHRGRYGDDVIHPDPIDDEEPHACLAGSEHTAADHDALKPGEAS